MLYAPQETRTFFITTITANRRRIFQVEKNAQALLNVLEEHRTKGRYQLHAYVLMPDHIHLLLTPAPEISLEKAMQLIKGNFSFHLKSKLDVWQQSFARHCIHNARDYEIHREYIHQNPVRAQLCGNATDFSYSSAANTANLDPAPENYSADLRFDPQIKK